MQTPCHFECAVKNAPGAATLAALVDDFLSGQGDCSCGELVGYRNKPLKEALIMAARADDGYGKTHSHQWKLWERTSERAKGILVRNINGIAACNDFDSLHSLIKSKLNIPGAAEMYWYDTAFRIGINLGLYPDKVYLHRGTRIGAQNLGLDFRKDTLEMSELPKELQKLKPYQAEDFLCICKDSLERFRSSR